MNFKTFILLFAALVVALASCDKEELQLNKDKDAIQEFLDTNFIDAKDTANIYYIVLREGTGEQVVAGDTVAYKYKVRSISDTTFVIDEQLTKAYTSVLPTEIPDEYGSIIPGLQIGLLTMRVGGKSRFFIPSTYAYGQYSIGQNETYANLMFDVELCEIKHNGAKH